MKPASLPFRRVFSGTSTAPAPSAPRAAMTQSLRFGRPERHPVAGGDAGGDEGGAGGEYLRLKLAEAQLLPALDQRRRIAEQAARHAPTRGDRGRYVSVHTLKIANHTVRCDPC